MVEHGNQTPPPSPFSVQAFNRATTSNGAQGFDYGISNNKGKITKNKCFFYFYKKEFVNLHDQNIIVHNIDIYFFWLLIFNFHTSCFSKCLKEIFTKVSKSIYIFNYSEIFATYLALFEFQDVIFFFFFVYLFLSVFFFGGFCMLFNLSNAAVSCLTSLLCWAYVCMHWPVSVI